MERKIQCNECLLTLEPGQVVIFECRGPSGLSLGTVFICSSLGCRSDHARYCGGKLRVWMPPPTSAPAGEIEETKLFIVFASNGVVEVERPLRTDSNHAWIDEDPQRALCGVLRARLAQLQTRATTDVLCDGVFVTPALSVAYRL